MIAPSARMMLLDPPYAGKRLRKLRFLMTDNKRSGHSERSRQSRQ
jgi:hypothetical protein